MTLVTTLGPLRRASDRGLVLPHEHVFCDLRTYESPDRADEAEVGAVMAPFLRQARELGVTAMVEPSTVGVGRRVDLLLTLSQATGLPLVVPTGVYREPWIPPWVHSAELPRGGHAKQGRSCQFRHQRTQGSLETRLGFGGSLGYVAMGSVCTLCLRQPLLRCHSRHALGTSSSSRRWSFAG